MKHYLPLLFVLLAFSIGAQRDPNQAYIFNENTSAFAPKTYALLIGVSSYPNLTDSKQLKWADNDALMMMDHLKSQDNVELYLYTNEDATNPMLLGKKIHEILTKKAKQLDKVIIYFSGHGDISSEDQNGYLLLNQVDKPTVTPYSWSDAIPIEKIKSTILSSNVNKENVHLIFDACKSGYAMANVSGSNFVEHQKIVMMLSSQAQQNSQEIDTLRHSAFSYYLIQGLNGLADLNEGNEITFAELSTYVSAKVVQATAGAQVPLFQNQNSATICSRYSDEKKTLAQENDKDLQQLNLTASLKGMESGMPELNERCAELYALMQKQAENGVFFQDEVDMNQEKLQIGLLEEVYKKESGLAKFQHSKSANYAVSLEAGKLQIFNGSRYRNGLELSKDQIRDFAFSPSEKVLCTVHEDGSLHSWNPNTGDELIEAMDLNETPQTITFLNENEVLIGTSVGKIIRYDLIGQQMKSTKLSKSGIRKMLVHNSMVYSLHADGILSVYNLNENIKLTQHKLNASDFAILSESNQLLATSGSTFSSYDITSMKPGRTLSFKATLTQIAVDPFGQYAVLGTTGRSVELVDIFNFIEKKNSLKTKSGIQSIEFIKGKDQILLVDETGHVSAADFKIEMGLSAFNVKQLLLNCSNDPQLEEQINSDLIIELDSKIKPVFRELVISGEENLSLETLQDALRYAKELKTLGKDEVLDPTKLDINILLLEAYSTLKSGNRSEFPKALKSLEQIYELDPNSSYAHSLAARIHLKMENTDGAKKELAKAEEMAPNWATPKIVATEILLNEKKYADAEAKIQTILSVDDEHADAYSALAKVQLLSGNSDKARISLEKALELNKNVSLSDTVSKHFADLTGAKTIEQGQVNQGKPSNPKPKSGRQEIGLIGADTNIDLRDGLQVGDFYEGGTVFYIDATGRHGLTVAYQWEYAPMNWDEGMNYILKLELNGFDDWKMPTIEEMQIFSLSRVFAPVSVFWTTSKYHLIPGHIMWYDTEQRIYDHTQKENRRYILPIREF